MTSSPVPVLELLAAVEDVQAGRPVDYPGLHRLIERRCAEDTAGRHRGLWIALAATVRHLEHGRLAAARAVLGTALVRAVSRPLDDEPGSAA